MTQDRKAWPEKIAQALQPVGTEKQGQWFTHAAIVRRIVARYGTAPKNVAQVLYDLVKSGHVHRAAKPQKLRDAHSQKPEYIYRRTGKAFKPKELLGGAAFQRGLERKRDYSGLPKWFRDMME